MSALSPQSVLTAVVLCAKLTEKPEKDGKEGNRCSMKIYL